MAFTYALIACRSITYAQRAGRILNKAGISASVKRLPKLLPNRGCGHAVRVEQSSLTQAKAILAEAEFEITGVFCSQPDGSLEDCP